MINWETCKDSFRWDGSLRDIYVTDVSKPEWEKAYRLFLQYAGVDYSVDEFPEPPPQTIVDVFACRVVDQRAPRLRFRVGRATLVCHFFSLDEIECDLDPREIESQADLDALLEFVARLGDAVEKAVAITPENCPANPIIAYDPWTKAIFHVEAAH